jgi:hypothetical protein
VSAVNTNIVSLFIVPSLPPAPGWGLLAGRTPNRPAYSGPPRSTASAPAARSRTVCRRAARVRGISDPRGSDGRWSPRRTLVV